MEKLSGLILDYYDDQDGTVLDGDAPEVVKTAHLLTPEERDRLPDDVFALVAVSDGVALKKFAMVDRGNTQLSIDYFLKTGHKLPKEAQKVAAANLLEGCDWYGIDPPDTLEKIAIGALTLLNVGLTAPGGAKEIKKNLQAVRGAGGSVMTPQQIKGVRMGLGA